MFRQELSTLKARKRSLGEREYNADKQAALALRKEHLCQITSLQHLLSPSSQQQLLVLGDAEKLAQTNAQTAKRLQQIQESCQAQLSILASTAQDFCAKLHHTETAQRMERELELELQSLSTPSPVASLQQEEEIQQLELQLAHQQQQIVQVQSKLATAKQTLEQFNQQCHTMQILRDENANQSQQYQLIEGPQREQLEIILGFTKLKTSVHERMSGHKICSHTNGKRVELELIEDGAKIEIEFDSHYRAVHISTQSILTGSKMESDLRLKALEANNPAWFVRKVKLLIHNSCLLQSELAELQTSRCTLEYKPSTRQIWGLFGETVSVKLRVPYDYLVSPVELLGVESTIVKKRDAVQDKLLEDKVRQGVRNHGLRVKDWITRVEELL
ncbi:hypothetical protein BASA81_007544 [Batrachochytrium salamandrivorans]|nr:hypothetical protein BASA81_007544 [Batrachochytrium salamandrivorans]